MFFMVGIIFCLVWLVKECTKEQQPEQQPEQRREQRRRVGGYMSDGEHGERYGPTSFSHPNNNHDHMKHPHATRADAMAQKCAECSSVATTTVLASTLTTTAS